MRSARDRLRAFSGALLKDCMERRRVGRATDYACENVARAFLRITMAAVDAGDWEVAFSCSQLRRLWRMERPRQSN